MEDKNINYKKGKLDKIKDALSRKFFRLSVPEDLLVVFYRQLAEMINSGITIYRALGILLKQSDNKNFKIIINGLMYYLSKEGIPFSAAMAKFPSIFPPVYVAMVTAAEKGGFMPTALRMISDSSENENKLKKQFYSTITYPVFIIIITLLSMIVMLKFILPAFSPMMESLNVPMPLPTRILNWTVSVFNHPLTILTLAVIFVLFYRYIHTTAGKKRFEKFCLGLPIIGNTMKYVAIVRFSRIYSLLCTGGFPIFQSLMLVSRSLGSYFYQERLGVVVEDVKGGMTLSEAIDKQKIFPKIVASMLRVGEESGKMRVSLQKLSRFYELEIEHIMNRFFSILEPVLLIYMGIMVGLVIVSIFLPMYQIVTNMN